MPVGVKLSPGRVKPEQRDAARVAARSGLPLREVLYRAESAWRQRDERPGDEGEDSGPGPSPEDPAPA